MNDERGSWQDELYRQIFDDETRGLQRRLETDRSFTLDALKGQLSALYLLDGQDWLGRGAAGDITSAATLAAYERFAAAWENTLSRAAPPPQEPGNQK